MIIFKVFSKQSEVTFGEFGHKKWIFLVRLQFKTVATTNMTDRNATDRVVIWVVITLEILNHLNRVFL